MSDKVYAAIWPVLESKSLKQQVWVKYLLEKQKFAKLGTEGGLRIQLKVNFHG